MCGLFQRFVDCEVLEGLTFFALAIRMCSAANSRKVFVIPGNGSGDILAANWYKWLRDQVNKTGVECVVKNMPDPGFLN